MGLEDFYQKIISPFVRDFEANPADLRLAYGAVWAVECFAAHIHQQYKSDRLADFTWDIDYKQHLRKMYPDFAIVFDVSAALKHAERSDSRTSVKTSSEVMSFNLEGWPAFFGGLEGEDWGRQVIVHGDHHTFRPLLPIVISAEKFLLEEAGL